MTNVFGTVFVDSLGVDVFGDVFAYTAVAPGTTYYLALNYTATGLNAMVVSYTA